MTDSSERPQSGAIFSQCDARYSEILMIPPLLRVLVFLTGLLLAYEIIIHDSADKVNYFLNLFFGNQPLPKRMPDLPGKRPLLCH